MKSKTIMLKRFLSKLIKDEKTKCWLWTGARTKRGYGMLRFSDGSGIQATKMSHILFIGPVPKGFELCHKCDVPRCVNPKHLFLGTRKDNMQDCKNKNRFRSGHVPGEKNGMAKLTEAKVLRIKKMLGILSRQEIAKKFKVSDGCIWFIEKGITWKHL